MDTRSYNRQAWDKMVNEGDEWTIPVDSETIEAARRGEWEIFLTRARPVPCQWFPDIVGLKVLCLASGGGQQGPVLSAAGARVTVLDNSPNQLAHDRFVAQRDGLNLSTIEGDMADLSMFGDESYDLVVLPVSNLFIPNIQPVWIEAHRILRHKGILMAGFMNPTFYIFNRFIMDDEGILKVQHSLPYCDLESVNEKTVEVFIEAGWPLEFGHTLQCQIGGQVQAGFLITDFYEDRDTRSVLDRYMPLYIAPRALKL